MHTWLKVTKVRLSSGGLVAKSCLTLATPWTVARKAPLSVGFPRLEYWSGLPFPSLGDLPDPGIEPASHALAGCFFTTEPPGKQNSLLLPHKLFKTNSTLSHCRM